MKPIPPNSVIAAEQVPAAPSAGSQGRPCAVVIFGVTGDPAKRKLVPALYNLMADGSLPGRLRIVGVTRAGISSDQQRNRFRESTAQLGRRKSVDEAVWSKFAGALDFVNGQIDKPGPTPTKKSSRSSIAKKEHRAIRIFYLATPPEAFAVILENLRKGGLLYRANPEARKPWSRVVIEKPFGRDLESARALNRLVAESLDESQTFRIDHYLGKETVQNILVFRYANSLFEPLWNRKYIDHVEITAAETLGVEKPRQVLRRDRRGPRHRAKPSAPGARACAMEPPVSFDADDVRDEKVQVLRSLRPLTGEDLETHVVRGQYDGYREEAGRVAGLTNANLRRDEGAHRQLAMAGRALLPASRQEARSPTHRSVHPLSAGAELPLPPAPRPRRSSSRTC